MMHPTHTCSNMTIVNLTHMRYMEAKQKYADQAAAEAVIAR